MSTRDEEPTEFERHARAMLEESVTRIDGRMRSRLNQARHAALEQAAGSQRIAWRHRALVPAGVTAAAAVAIVAVVTWQNKEPRSLLSMEDVELLADGEALELLEDDGAFYAWALGEEAGG